MPSCEALVNILDRLVAVLFPTQVIFRPSRVQVIGRFALAGGNPYAPDASGTTRSMAPSP